MKVNTLKVLVCILFIEIVYIWHILCTPEVIDLLFGTEEQTITDDRGLQVNIPDYPTAVIPSDLRIAPIIEAFAHENTAMDKSKSTIITLPKDVKNINDITSIQYPMVVIDMSSPSKVLEAYTKLGTIFHREDIAESITSDCKDAITEAVNIVSGQEKKRVLYLKAPYVIPKEGTIEDNILLESQVVSIWNSGVTITEKDDSCSQYSIEGISKEEIEAFAPDIIICKTNVGKQTIIHDMPELDAVKNEKVFSIEDTNYHFDFDEYHSIPAVIWVIKRAYELDTPDPDKFFKWYIAVTKRNYKL